jgi:hypothetical protein
VIRCDLCGSGKAGMPQIIGRVGRRGAVEEVFCPRRFHAGPIDAATVEDLLRSVADRLESQSHRVRRMIGLVADLQHVTRPDPGIVIAIRHQLERDHAPDRACGSCNLALEIIAADTAARTPR